MKNEGLLFMSFLKVSWRKISWGIPLLLYIRNALGDLSLGIDSCAAGPVQSTPTLPGLVQMLRLTGYTETTAQRTMGFLFQERRC